MIPVNNSIIVIFLIFVFIKATALVVVLHLTLSWRTSLSYRNESIDLQWKSMDWFLHDSKET